MKKIFLIVMLTIAGIMAAMAQVNLDSLEYVFVALGKNDNFTKNDNLTKRVQICVQLSQQFLMVNAEKSKYYSHLGVELAQKAHDKDAEMRIVRQLCNISASFGEYDSAFYYNNRMGELAYKIKNVEYENMFLFNKGNLFLSMSKLDSALYYYQKVLPCWEKLNDEYRVSATKSNISLIYKQLCDFGKAEKYALEAIKSAEKNDDRFTIAQMSGALYDIYRVMDRPDESLQYAEKAVKVARTTNNKLLLSVSLQYLSAALNERKEYQKSLKLAYEGLQIAKEHGLQSYVSGSYTQIAKNLIGLKRYNEAKLQLDTALVLADTLSAYYMELIYRTYLELYASKGDVDKVMEYQTKMSASLSNIHNMEMTESIAEMEVKYETEKKEFQITTLEKEKRLMKWVGIVGAAALLAGLAALFFIYLWTKQKRRKAELQIKQLEQEKQLIATQAVLDGETQERVRLARDLHDGLGGMLSAVKMNLYEMKNENYILERHDVGIFEKALDMLDRSVGELRRVAHHLMPESLVNNGLRISLEDFCRAIPNAHFEYFGNDGRLDRHLELMLYHCAYELINNAIKHAQAKNINVQLQIANHSASLTVSDDGIGFDNEKAVKGAGLDNIRQRVMSYNGKFHIDSEPNKGTEATIDIESLK